MQAAEAAEQRLVKATGLADPWQDLNGPEAGVVTRAFLVLAASPAEGRAGPDEIKNVLLRDSTACASATHLCEIHIVLAR